MLDHPDIDTKQLDAANERLSALLKTAKLELATAKNDCANGAQEVTRLTEQLYDIQQRVASETRTTEMLRSEKEALSRQIDVLNTQVKDLQNMPVNQEDLRKCVADLTERAKQANEATEQLKSECQRQRQELSDKSSQLVDANECIKTLQINVTKAT